MLDNRPPPHSNVRGRCRGSFTTMGQYYKGLKIGTCENMYYMRIEEARKLADMHAMDDDKISFREYLADNQTRFRFPFPEEDGLDHVELVGKNAPPSVLLPAVGLVANEDHDTITVSTGLVSGGHNMNIFLPCPYSNTFKDLGIKTSYAGAGAQYVVPVFQCLRNGEEKTVFKCARCGVMFRAPSEDVAKIKEQSLQHYAHLDQTPFTVKDEGKAREYARIVEILNRIK